ncbi:hypothetical protein MRX96_006274 [Rhipicephalus microplus]
MVPSSEGPRASLAGFDIAGRPPAQSLAVTSVPENQSEDEVAFQKVKSKAALRHARLPLGGSLRGIHRLSLAQALSLFSGVADIKVNYRIDATTQEGLAELLAMIEATRHSSFCQGAGKLPYEPWFPACPLPGLLSAVPVPSATKEGRTVTLRFEGPGLPVQALYAVVGRPRGAGLLTDKDVVSTVVAHTLPTHRSAPADKSSRKVATIMASSATILSSQAVAAAVREETREARSYASIVKGHPLSGHSVPAHAPTAGHPP